VGDQGLAAVSEARKAAFYALPPGGWRDYVTLLHPPYTAWHLSFVALGAVTAPTFSGRNLVASLVAFFLAVGLAAHALDEFMGHPLGTRIPDRVLTAIAGVGLVGAVFLGFVGAVEVSFWLVPFIAVGVFLVLAYNLEFLGGSFHTDTVFAVAWGAFPALTGAFAQDGSLSWRSLVVAVACMLLAAAQRRLSTPVRRFRRRVTEVAGSVTLDDGTVVEIDEGMFLHPSEAALRAMAVGLSLLAIGLVAVRL
jgi:hypothetical protein